MGAESFAQKVKTEDKKWIPVQAGPPGQGHEIYVLSTGFFPGGSLKDEVFETMQVAGTEADLFWLADQVQGICHHRELQLSCRCECQVLQGGSHHHPRGHPSRPSSPCGEAISKPHALPCKMTGTVALCWCTSSHPQRHWHPLRPFPRSCC